MDNKFFGIGSTYRSTIPDAKRATGFGATQEPFEYINQALFELKTDHIIGTAAQLALGQCTCKYQSSDQTLRDSSGTEVTLTDGDRVYIIGLETLTADFDLSAYDRLRVKVDPSVSLGNNSQDLVFGDECHVELYVSSESGLVYGSDFRGFVNGARVGSYDKTYLGDGTDFTIAFASPASGVTLRHAWARPYQTLDGEWFMDWGMFAEHAGNATWTFTISGIICKNIAYYRQSAGYGAAQNLSATGSIVYGTENTNSFSCATTSGACTKFSTQGTIHLNAKPTWAD